MSGRKRKSGAGRSWLPYVTVGALACTALLALLSYLAVRDIEQGLLATVADQQDEYVDLVVGQIDLHNEADDDSIINNILGVIDSSSGQYWTFSRDDAMLYVRDASETSKYKGMPASTYLGEGEAEEFYEGLSTDKTTHDYVTVDGRDYIASGRAFEYDGSTYRLCLMTNEDTVLDGNQLLGARSRLGALLGIEAVLLLFVAIGLAGRGDRLARQLSAARGEVARLNGTITRLNRRIARGRFYSPEEGLWSADALADFESSLAKRGERAWLAELTFPSEEERSAFVDRADVLLGGDVPRFADGESPLVVGVLFVRTDREKAQARIASTLGEHDAEVSWCRVGASSEKGEV